MTVAALGLFSSIFFHFTSRYCISTFASGLRFVCFHVCFDSFDDAEEWGGGKAGWWAPWSWRDCKMKKGLLHLAAASAPGARGEPRRR